jgi:hypothetical protein
MPGRVAVMVYIPAVEMGWAGAAGDDTSQRCGWSAHISLRDVRCCVCVCVVLALSCEAARLYSTYVKVYFGGEEKVQKHMSIYPVKTIQLYITWQ